jgi:hypothetical protein
MRLHPARTALCHRPIPFAAWILLASSLLCPPLWAGLFPATTAGDVKVKCVTPDGRVTEVSNLNALDTDSPASIIDHDTINCALHPGKTTFIIALPKGTPADSITFVNDNSAACGEMRIAVADSLLPANSPRWIKVDGIVPFVHKRLFKLSMLGVETRFIRLSFQVEKSETDSPDRSAARISSTFHSSALAAAIDSPFVNAHGSRTDLLASFGFVAPLSLRSSR